MGMSTTAIATNLLEETARDHLCDAGGLRPQAFVEVQSGAAAVLVDEPKPNWVRFVDCRLEAGPPKRDAST
jgi:hypothetical protein